MEAITSMYNLFGLVEHLLTGVDKFQEVLGSVSGAAAAGAYSGK
jgi:hypothetical protein